MNAIPINVKRADAELAPDPTRVLLRSFTPGDVPRLERIVTGIRRWPTKPQRNMDRSMPSFGQKLLARFFTPEMGFGTIVHVDCTDGIRVLFDNGDVAHVRPSGNADELRIYSVADTQARADAIAAMGVAEPDGILRRMQKGVAVDA